MSPEDPGQPTPPDRPPPGSSRLSGPLALVVATLSILLLSHAGPSWPAMILAILAALLPLALVTLRILRLLVREAAPVPLRACHRGAWHAFWQDIRPAMTRPAPSSQAKTPRRPPPFATQPATGRWPRIR